MAVFPLTELCQISATLRDLETRLYARPNRKREADLAVRAGTLARQLRARLAKAHPTLSESEFPFRGLDSLTKTLTEFNTTPSPRREILVHIARTTVDEELLFGLRRHEPFASDLKAVFERADRLRRVRRERYLNDHLCESAKG